jgi:regulator of protease activity HflC (stomatin/prohibitin superfamily)
VQLANTTLRTIIGPHGMPKSLVSDRDPRITARFWRELSRVLGIDMVVSDHQVALNLQAECDRRRSIGLELRSTLYDQYERANGEVTSERRASRATVTKQIPRTQPL